MSFPAGAPKAQSGDPEKGRFASHASRRSISPRSHRDVFGSRALRSIAKASSETSSDSSPRLASRIGLRAPLRVGAIRPGHRSPEPERLCPRDPSRFRSFAKARPAKPAGPCLAAGPKNPVRAVRNHAQGSPASGPGDRPRRPARDGTRIATKDRDHGVGTPPCMTVKNQSVSIFPPQRMTATSRPDMRSLSFIRAASGAAPAPSARL